MPSTRTVMLIGGILIVIGGAALAYLSEQTGTLIGTGLGMLGLGLVAWAVFRRDDGEA